MGEEGERGVKSIKKWVLSFIDGPLRKKSYIYPEIDSNTYVNIDESKTIVIFSKENFTIIY